MKKNWVEYMSCLFLLLVFASAQADPPRVVYRVDERHPDQIFPEGFQAWGRNDYLYAHVLGASLIRSRGTEGSNFVATTDSLETAMLIARRRWTFNPGLRDQPLYLYTIRAEGNMYEVDAYMENLESNVPEGEDSRSIEQARRAYRYQQEWVAAAGTNADRIAITPQQIHTARELRFREGQLPGEDYGLIIVGEEFQNTGRFQDGPTQASDRLYPRLGTQNYHRTMGGRAYVLDSPMDLLRGIAISLAYCPDMPGPSGLGKVKTTLSADCSEPTPVDLKKMRARLVSILGLALVDED
jgi:hypothetical protein